VQLQAVSWVHWYLGVDFILAISLTLFFYWAIKRLQLKGYLSGARWITYAPLAYGAADCVENFYIWRLVSHRTSEGEVSAGIASMAAFIVDIKWAALALCVIIVIVGLLYRGDDDKSPWWAITAGQLMRSASQF
jgi:hypothetical protein